MSPLLLLILFVWVLAPFSLVCLARHVYKLLRETLIIWKGSEGEQKVLVSQTLLPCGFCGHKSCWLWEERVPSLKSWGTKYRAHIFCCLGRSWSCEFPPYFMFLSWGWGLWGETFQPFPTCSDVGIFSFRSCLAGFWMSFTENCSVRSSRFGVSVGVSEFGSLLCCYCGSNSVCTTFDWTKRLECSWESLMYGSAVSAVELNKPKTDATCKVCII